MSHSTMHYVPDCGAIVSAVEFRNAWGWSASVWSRCCKHLLRVDENAWLHGKPATFDAIFELIDNAALPREIRLVIQMTDDKAIVLRDRFEEVARALEAFDATYPANHGYVNHLPAIAAALREVPPALDDGRPIIGVCLTGTSVADDQWDREDPSVEDGWRAFDFSLDSDRIIVGEYEDAHDPAR